MSSHDAPPASFLRSRQFDLLRRRLRRMSGPFRRQLERIWQLEDAVQGVAAHLPSGARRAVERTVRETLPETLEHYRALPLLTVQFRRGADGRSPKAQLRGYFSVLEQALERLLDAARRGDTSAALLESKVLEEVWGQPHRFGRV